MVINTEEEAEEPPPVHFGDMRESIGCDYIVNVFARPGGGGVLGAGSHRYGFYIFTLHLTCFITSKSCGSNRITILRCMNLTLYSQDRFDLIQMQNDRPWRFVSESRVSMADAHGEEVIRSFCFVDKVSSLFEVSKQELETNFHLY